ncbi:alpha/beta hydrolase [Actibacterium lipolyticum]|uniref:Putative hydrolase MhqD n=1 Tax=Actibacterium lipolyticum TaxID=1524263 RepID=A0A238KWR2_9RHOB|nr:alpha/beta hydrolase [Actibacterium lipolyticum]SMX47235.1 Putative hydrolase MhqD [Actibacterium lipolyticum]
MADYITRKTPGTPNGTLIFIFHGTGGDENQFHGFAQELIPGATVISLRGDVSEGGALRFFRRRAEGLYDMNDLAVRVRALAGFLEKQKADVAPTRTIGLGYSNGANIMAAISFLHPSIFDDMALMHPLIPWAPDPQPGLSASRVLITAGQRDPICPAPETQALADYFSAQGTDVTLEWHPGGHEVRDTELTALRAFLTT